MDSRSRPTASPTGKITPKSIPPFSDPPATASVQRLTTAGPPMQPRSPARARRANMAVPPPRRATAERLKVPGQKMPTEKPQSPHPTRDRRGDPDRAAVT